MIRDNPKINPEREYDAERKILKYLYDQSGKLIKDFDFSEDIVY